MTEDKEVTNENLAEGQKEIQAKLDRVPETIAAVVHDAMSGHVESLPHSAVSAESAKKRDEEIKILADTSNRVIEILEGKTEQDLRGNPRVVEPGLVHRVEAIQKNTNGVKRKVDLPIPAWVGIIGALIAAVWNALQN